MLCGKNHEPCGYERLWGEVEQLGAAFVKPSMGSYQGISAFKLNLSEADSPENLAKVLFGSGDNYVIQGLVSQYEAFASPNNSSVNIIRMNTVRLGEENPFLANATIRFGIPGRFTDVTYVDGGETVRVVGITEEGVVREFFYDQDGNKAPLSELSPSIGGAVLPGFGRVREVCLAAHRRLPHFGIVAFDVAIADSTEPAYANDPFFGERTEEVIEWCMKRTLREKPWDLS